MNKTKLVVKEILKESIFDVLFTLWTAPIDEPKLDLSQTKASKAGNNWFPNNLIIGQRS